MWGLIIRQVPFSSGLNIAYALVVCSSRAVPLACSAVPAEKYICAWLKMKCAEENLVELKILQIWYLADPIGPPVALSGLRTPVACFCVKCNLKMIGRRRLFPDGIPTPFFQASAVATDGQRYRTVIKM